MTQERLDEARVGAVLQHVRRAGVTEQMTGAGLLDAGEVHVTAHALGDDTSGVIGSP